MRIFVIILFLVIVVGLVWRATGHALPLFDYQIGGFGGWLGPEIRITPPGYNVSVP